MTTPVEPSSQAVDQDTSFPNAPLELSVWDSVLLGGLSATGNGLRARHTPVRPAVTAADWAEAA